MKDSSGIIADLVVPVLLAVFVVLSGPILVIIGAALGL